MGRINSVANPPDPRHQQCGRPVTPPVGGQKQCRGKQWVDGVGRAVTASPVNEVIVWRDLLFCSIRHEEGEMRDILTDE